MPSGVSVASGFGGFAKGFANALAEGRRVQREEEHRAEDRKLKEFGTIFPLIFDEAQQTGDYTRANEIIGEYMPNVGKTMKKRGVDLASIAPVLAPATPQTSGQNAATSKTFIGGDRSKSRPGAPAGCRHHLEPNSLPSGCRHPSGGSWLPPALGKAHFPSPRSGR